MKVHSLHEIFSSMDSYPSTTCNLSDCDSWCYDHHTYTCGNEYLRKWKLTHMDLSTLEAVSFVLDSSMEGVPHQWGKWGWMENYDVLHRKCICGAEMKISGVMMSQLPDGAQHALEHLQAVWFNMQPHNVEQAEENMTNHLSLLKEHFPGTVDLTDEEYQILEEIPTPPLELTEQHMDDIVKWLEKPYEQFDSDKQEFWELMVAVKSGISVHQSLAETNSILPYTIVLIKRLPVVFADKRWWVDMAIRVDTGEPIAMVNHQGDWDQYRKEVLFAPKANPSQAD
jgi:hypothetical protein